MHRLSALVLIVAVLALGLPGHASAETKDPCRLLKQAELARVFGAETGKPQRSGPSCEWEVPGTNTRPSGAVYTTMYFTRPKFVFNSNKRDYGDTLVAVSELGKDAFYQPTGSDGVVWVLKGGVLVTVQGTFVAIGDEPEADPAAIQEELVELAKLARKRA